jgi:hypothetical protein
VTHHVDGVRFAERQVQYDDLGGDQLELLKHGRGFRELDGSIAAAGQNADDGGTHAGIVIKNVNGARASFPGGSCGRNLAHRPDSTARLWSGDQLIEAAIARVPRCLSPGERRAVFLANDPPDWCYALAKSPYKPRRESQKSATYLH